MASIRGIFGSYGSWQVLGLRIPGLLPQNPIALVFRPGYCKNFVVLFGSSASHRSELCPVDRIMSLTFPAFLTAVRIGRLFFGLILQIAAPVAAGVKRAAASKRWPLPPRWPADRTGISRGVSEFRWQTRCAFRAVRIFRRQPLNRP